MMKENNIPKIPADKFRFVGDEIRLHDQKMDTKQISYFRDAFNRFCKNKSSVTAAIIIMLLVLYAIFIPMFCQTPYSLALTDTDYLMYGKLLPRNQLCVDMGWDFWDGFKDRKDITKPAYDQVRAVAEETGLTVMKNVEQLGKNEKGIPVYNIRVDSYIYNGSDGAYTYMTLTEEQYKSMQAWQNESGIQLIYPAVDDTKLSQKNKLNADIWYEANEKGVPQVDKNDNFVDIYKQFGNDGSYNSLRIEGDPGLEDPNSPDRYRYASITGDSSAISYKCRVLKYAYFQYKYGFEPSFLFGTTAMGQDMLTRLATAARFSLLLAICVSALNLFIGAVYGAIQGYYGGAIDLLMDRFTDILARIPFMVVATLFQLHLAKTVGPVISLLFAFVLTGWIGMSSTVRMQFYRFKGQEYVLASRVLGASDWRIMFRHIFPNSLGTIVTSSVLVIPGVIFSESSLTYLGIVNLDSSTMTSVGTMLANGRTFLQDYPHVIFFPALFISLLMISFNLFGNGLRDAFNPSLRGADD